MVISFKRLSSAGAWRRAVSALSLCALAPWALAADTAGATRLRIVGSLAGINLYTQIEEPFWTTELPKLTGGKLTAEIVPFDRAGIRPAEALRMIQLGVVPFATFLIGLTGPQDLLLSAPDLAGLSPDMPSLRRNMAAYRPFVEKTLRERYGVEPLAFYTYPAQVTYCTKPFNGLADLAGRRVRTSSTSQADMMDALGAINVRTGFAEILANIQSGNIDCVITGTMSGNTIGLHEVTTHMHAMAVNWGVSVFAANGAAWNALSAEHRALLKTELARMERAAWEAAERETAMGMTCNTGQGNCVGGHKGHMALVRTSPADDQRRREILASTVLERWVQRCGPQCAQVWNQTIGPAAGVMAKTR